MSSTLVTVEPELHQPAVTWVDRDWKKFPELHCMVSGRLHQGRQDQVSLWDLTERTQRELTVHLQSVHTTKLPELLPNDK